MAEILTGQAKSTSVLAQALFSSYSTRRRTARVMFAGAEGDYN